MNGVVNIEKKLVKYEGDSKQTKTKIYKPLLDQAFLKKWEFFHHNFQRQKEVVNESKAAKRKLLNNNKKECVFVKHVANKHFIIAVIVPKNYLPNFGKKLSSNIHEKLYFIIFVIYYFVIYQILFVICYAYQVNLEDWQRKKMKKKL